MSAVAPPMMVSVTRKAYLRPTRSPMRPKNKAHREGGQVRDERNGIVASRIKLWRKYSCQTAENIKVVPLDHGANRGGKNHSPNAVVRRCPVESYGAAGHVVSP